MKKARRYARKNRLDFILDTKSGKGSHVKLTVGMRFTFVKYGKIRRGTMASMLKQLGIDRREF